MRATSLCTDALIPEGHRAIFWGDTLDGSGMLVVVSNRLIPSRYFGVL